MKNRNLLAFYGCTHHPFSEDIPPYALHLSRTFETFKYRLSHLAENGGFALLSGAPGLGKSTLLRSLSDHLNSTMNIAVAEINRPQSSISDFYRELGAIFDVELSFFNKYYGFKQLRERWSEHLRKTQLKPLIIIDEAQEANPEVLSEIRLLSSECFDSKLLVTVLLAGDFRLIEKLKKPGLLPLYTRMKVKMELTPYSKEDLVIMLENVLEKASSPSLISSEGIHLIAEKSYGNPRLMMNTCNELLGFAFQKKDKQITEDHYLQYYS